MFLKGDVALKKKDEEPIFPIHLYESRTDYQVYPLHVFRGHIYQEMRFQKYCTWRNDVDVAKETEQKAVYDNAFARI